MAKLVNVLNDNLQRQKFDFEEFFSFLIEYKISHNDSVLVTKRYKTPNGYNLGGFLQTVRLGKTPITEEQKKQLIDIGVKFGKLRVSEPFRFEEFYTRLLDYKNKYGTLHCKTSYKFDDGYDLGGRINRVPTGMVKLNEEQKNRLNNIGFVWNDKIVFNFKRFYEELTNYKEIYGDCRVPYKYITNDGYRLGKQVQHVRFADVKVSENEIKLLNEIGFIWDAKIRFDFDKFLSHLSSFKEKFGHCNVPFGYVSSDGYRLYKALMNVRSGHSYVSREQSLLLTEIGFTWKGKGKGIIQNFNFDVFFNNLLDYKTNHLDVLVPHDYITEDGYKLGLVVRYIRVGRISLSAEQKNKLLSISFVFDVSEVSQEYTIKTEEEANEAILKAANGDLVARKKVIEYYQYLVKKVATKYARLNDFDSLVGQGNMGLMRAIDRYEFRNCDESEFAPFAPFAYKYIKYAIIELLRGNIRNSSLSLDAPIMSENEESNKYSVTECKTIPRTDDEAIEKIFSNELITMIKSKLSDTEFKIISLRFGLIDGVSYSSKTIAKKFNTYEAKINGVINKALDILRKNMPANEWLNNY